MRKLLILLVPATIALLYLAYTNTDLSNNVFSTESEFTRMPNAIGMDSGGDQTSRVGSNYSEEALNKNLYLGWAPRLVNPLISASSFSWRSCFNPEGNGHGPQIKHLAPRTDQPPGCREHPSELGAAPPVNSSWIPDPTMLRTMMLHGKDINGDSFPPPLSKELCQKMDENGGNSTKDTNMECFREAMIDPGVLTSNTVTISPWNHAGIAKSKTNETNRTSVTVPAPKVMCLIYTMETAHSTRIRAIRETWGGGCDGFLAFSTKSDPRLPAIHLTIVGKEEYDNMWQKSRAIWKFVGAHYLNQFDWFIIGGDDLFLLTHNLKKYLASLAYKDNADPRTKEYYVGKRQKSKGVYFNTGGAGYVLSQASLRKMLTVIDDIKICAASLRVASEDLQVAKCLKHFGIGLTDSRDSRGRERFHFFAPGSEFHWDINARNWYWDYNREWGLKNGPDCCAPDTVSFHYAKQPAMVRHFHALLHNCHKVRKALDPPH